MFCLHCPSVWYFWNKHQVTEQYICIYTLAQDNENMKNKISFSNIYAASTEEKAKREEKYAATAKPFKI